MTGCGARCCTPEVASIDAPDGAVGCVHLAEAYSQACLPFSSPVLTGDLRGVRERRNPGGSTPAHLLHTVKRIIYLGFEGRSAAGTSTIHTRTNADLTSNAWARCDASQSTVLFSADHG